MPALVNSSLPRRLSAGGLARLSPAARDALLVAALSRALVWLAAILSVEVIGAHNRVNALYEDAPRLTAAVPGIGRVLLTPLARWDSVWFLGIVQHGYAPLPGAGADAHARAAFFPLYPLLVWLASGLGSSRGVQLVAAFVVSLAAFTAALYLLHRLVVLELGREHALGTLLLLAFFPGALFFGVPYSESLFLLVTVGAFYAARTGHWAQAGLWAAAASATRSSGILIIVPLALFYLYGPRADAPALRERGLRPRYAVRPDVGWLALGVAGLAAYSAYLGLHTGDPLAWKHVEALWSRHFALPFGGIIDGARAAWTGAHGLIAGTAGRIYLQHGQLEPTRAAVADVVLFAFALIAVVATVGTFRRLPIAYGAWMLLSLALPLSYPATGQPLESLPRFMAVLFPLFMWLSLWARRRRALDLVLVPSVTVLGLLAAQYAAWEFVS